MFLLLELIYWLGGKTGVLSTSFTSFMSPATVACAKLQDGNEEQQFEKLDISGRDSWTSRFHFDSCHGNDGEGAGGALGESGALVSQEEQMVRAQAVCAPSAHH